MYNKSILTLAAIVVFTCLFISCKSSGEKVVDANEDVENAENKLDKANEELSVANQEYVADVENYKRATSEKIAENEKYIAEFKSRIANEKKEARAEYLEKLRDLEQKNTDAKLRLDGYQADAKDNWEEFKSDFNRNLDELGQSLKDFSKKNNK